MLPHGFLSMHLHITMQFSICHHPDLLIFIVKERGEKAIGYLSSVQPKQRSIPLSAGDDRPALMRQVGKGTDERSNYPVI